MRKAARWDATNRRVLAKIVGPCCLAALVASFSGCASQMKLRPSQVAKSPVQAAGVDTAANVELGPSGLPRGDLSVLSSDCT